MIFNLLGHGRVAALCGAGAAQGGRQHDRVRGQPEHRQGERGRPSRPLLRREQRAPRLGQADRPAARDLIKVPEREFQLQMLSRLFSR